ncbi:putative pollen-specific leucine-rich repeat extensin-like protein 3 [Iris pallida]|uniref:Pollen-specific leucine-rich repeat extensin-like protein 3 n=1 Tax=Iris pallida TaxID=29817 RepID=A0AAX6FXB4_IRIPA|nr:putative pollen-specific leucine-rich repeat extensin-like protein 3 [Iris pallida]
MLSSPSLLSFITHSQYNHATSIALANPTPNSSSSSSSSLDRPTLLRPRRRRPSPSPPPSPSSSSNTSSSLSPPPLSDHNRHGRAPIPHSHGCHHHLARPCPAGPSAAPPCRVAARCAHAAMQHQQQRRQGARARETLAPPPSRPRAVVTAVGTP